MPVKKSKSSGLRSTKGARVLVVDDNPDLLKLMSMRLKPMHFEVKTAESGFEALGVMSIWVPDIVITDLQMPNFDGLEFFEKIHSQYPLLPVIILTAHGTIPDAVKATQSGVASFLTKPFEGDSLIAELKKILRASGYSDGMSVDDSSTLQDAPFRLLEITSNSPKMGVLTRQIERLAPTGSTILIEGENGSGKNELTREIHRLSRRASKPLLHIFGAELPENLFLTELFGKVGTGSFENPERNGIFRDANGGTIILSDFNEASRSVVAKILTTLDKKRAKPVDSEQAYSIDIRLIATTPLVGRYGRHRPTSLNFWDKLEIYLLSVPPLRERREDIPLIANQCLLSLDDDKELSFANKSMQLMLAADWPGNARQLISVVRQCARLSTTKVISESLVNSRLSSPIFQIQPLSNAHRDFERNYLTDVLKATNGNVTRASEMAKRNRTEFHRLLKKHKIVAKAFRQLI